MKVKVIDKVHATETAKKVYNDAGLWTFAANTWYKLLEPFTPMDTGTLMKTVTIEPKKIHYMQEYAVYVYNGDGMNFQTTHHALACAHWDEAAAPMQKDKLVDAIQGYIDSGRLDI
jgi:hypothetical protein